MNGIPARSRSVLFSVENSSHRGVEVTYCQSTIGNGVGFTFCVYFFSVFSGTGVARKVWEVFVDNLKNFS